MTSVRLTKDVKSRINSQIFTLFQKRIAKAEGSLRTDFYDELTQAVVDKTIKPYIENTILPSSWMINVKTIEVRFKEIRNHYGISLNKEITVPNIATFFSIGTFKIEEKDIPERLFEEYMEYYDKLEKLKNEKKEFSEEVNKILNNCNTLSQFLKVWPQGKQLIEGLTFDTPTRTRRKRTVEVEESTLNTLNSKLLKQTMLNTD